MISEQDVQTYKRDGVIVVPEVLGTDTLAQIAVGDRRAGGGVGKDPRTHRCLRPRTRPYRGKPARPPDQDAAQGAWFVRRDRARSPEVLDILKKLIGPGLRLHGSKLNMKSAQYGSPVEWHQDWAFYPHTNDDILAIGVLLDDCDLSNGPMLVTPGTHTGEVWNHHGDDGCFAGLIDPDTIQGEIERAVPCMGRAGSMSFHHVRALHGSAMNTSDRPRNLLLYEVAASDAWPLMGVKDFDEFNSRLLSGDPVIAPRLTNVPVRLPLPPAKRQGSIYETQSAAKKSYFTRAA